MALGFKSTCGSHVGGDHAALAREGNHMALGLPLPCSLGSWKARCSSDAELSISSLEKCRTDPVGRKGVKGLLLVGHEKVPCGFELRTGEHSGATADGAGNPGRPAS